MSIKSLNKLLYELLKKVDGETLSHRREALHEFYNHSPRTLSLLIFSTIALCILFTRRLPDFPLYAWCAALILLSLYRIVSASRAKKICCSALEKPDDESRIDRLYMHYFFQALATALLVSLVVPLFLPYLHENILEYVIILFILGISTGAAISFYPSRLLFLCYITILNFPLILYYGFFLDLPDARFFALALLLYNVVLALLVDKTRSIHLELFRKRGSLHFKEREFNALFEQTPTPIFYFDTKLRMRKYNRAFAKLFNISAGNKSDFESFDLHQLVYKPTIDILNRVLQDQKPYEYEGPYISTFSPKEYWVRASVVPLYDDNLTLIGGIVNLQDKTTEKAMIEELQKMAAFDPLTALPNRRQLLRELESLVQKPNPERRLSLLLFLDLNRFKPINDTLGHQYGDIVLKKVASLLKSFEDEGKKIFRYGGDEFVLFEPLCCREVTRARAYGRKLSQEINELLKKEVLVEDHHFPLGASIGIIVITPEMRDTQEIIRRADVAMYQAKRDRSFHEFYDTSLDKNRKENFYLQQELKRPTLEGQLRLHYQPIHRISDGAMVAAEALLRWEHPERGLLGPSEFIDLAIESGEIYRLGSWVRREVFRSLREFEQLFPDDAFPLEYISLNVDARELKNRNFVPETERLIHKYGISEGKVVYELTENSLIDNFEDFQKVSDRLKNLGIRWSIDDFGIGYSSLSYLERLSLSFLKIDRSFILSLTEKNESFLLISYIVRIARHLGYRVIGEGIETLSQLEKLRVIDLQLYCQGYYFHPPMPKEEFQAYLLKEKR